MLIDDPTFEGIRQDREESWVALAQAVQGNFRAKTAQRVPESEVDDILQEVFIRVHGNLPNLKDGHHLENLVWRVWRQRLVDWYRKRKGMPVISLAASQGEQIEGQPATIQEPVDSQSNPERQALLMEFRAHLDHSRSLSSLRKLIITLHVFDDLSFTNIASVLNLNAANVETQYFRSIQSLLKELAIRAYRDSPSQFDSEFSENQKKALNCLVSGMTEKKAAKELGLRVPELAQLLAPAFQALAKAAAEDWKRILAPNLKGNP